MTVLTHAVVPPEIDLDSRGWWDALETGALEIPRCQGCGRGFFPPQPGCPHCGASSWQLAPSSGEGRLYSWVVIHHAFDPAFADDVPYVIAAVELDGVRLIGRWLEGTLVSLQGGMPVVAAVYRAGEQALLGFQAAGGLTGVSGGGGER